MNTVDPCQDLVGRQHEPHHINEETERSSSMPRVTQLERSRAGTETQLCTAPLAHGWMP